MKKAIFLVMTICALSLTACTQTAESSETVPQPEEHFAEDEGAEEEASLFTGLEEKESGQIQEQGYPVLVASNESFDVYLDAAVELENAVYSDWDGEKQVEDKGWIRQLTFTVYDKNGNLLQEIEHNSPYLPYVPNWDESYYFEDVNFDGADDLLLQWCNINHPIWKAYLWKEEEGIFQEELSSVEVFGYYFIGEEYIDATSPEGSGYYVNRYLYDKSRGYYCVGSLYTYYAGEDEAQEERFKEYLYVDGVYQESTEIISWDEVSEMWKSGEPLTEEDETGEAQEKEDDTSHMVQVTVDKDGIGTREYYGDIDDFLAAYGMENQEPDFWYDNLDGRRQMALYFNEETGIWCGVRDFYNHDASLFAREEPYGFVFERMEQKAWSAPEIEDISIEECSRLCRKTVDAYEEEYAYNEAGKITRFQAKGIDEAMPENGVHLVLQIDYTYRENGTLLHRAYAHDSFVFATWQCRRDTYFDALERVIYDDVYVTHGNMDYYYFYHDEEMTPDYCLILDYNTGDWYAEWIRYE